LNLKNSFSENEAWYTPNSNKIEDAATKFDQWQTNLKNLKQRRKAPILSICESLDWDSAFFTKAS